MLRRPQRTEDRLRAGGEDGAYLCGSLEGGGELNQWPRAQPAEAASAEARARGVRRSNARGVRAVQVSQSRSCSRPSPAAPPAAVLHAVTGGHSSQLPEVSDRKRRAK